MRARQRNGRKEEEGRRKRERGAFRGRERDRNGEIARRRREKTRGALSRSATAIVTSLNSTHTISPMCVTYFFPSLPPFASTRGGIPHRMTCTEHNRTLLAIDSSCSNSRLSLPKQISQTLTIYIYTPKNEIPSKVINSREVARSES